MSYTCRVGANRLKLLCVNVGVYGSPPIVYLLSDKDRRRPTLLVVGFEMVVAVAGVAIPPPIGRIADNNGVTDVRRFAIGDARGMPPKKK